MDENRTELSKILFEQYLKSEGSEIIDVLNNSLITQCEDKLGSAGKEIFAEIAQTVKSFLAGEPFASFLTSFYFYRLVFSLFFLVMITNLIKLNRLL